MFSIFQLFASCKEPDELVYLQQLPSPGSKLILYKYQQSPGSVQLAIGRMDEPFAAVSSKSTVIKGECFVLGWKNETTVRLQVVNSGSFTPGEPFKKSVIKIGDIDAEVEYYHIFSTNGSNFDADSSNINGDQIAIHGSDGELRFIKGRCEMVYDNGILRISSISRYKGTETDYRLKNKMLMQIESYSIGLLSGAAVDSFLSAGVLRPPVAGK
ncbi:MAG: hypothetical protein H7Y27_13920 [Gemmatimonadaceae bacterium]|nr:hypothetical protein [Chitinophagaceae bacterium]